MAKKTYPSFPSSPIIKMQGKNQGVCKICKETAADSFVTVEWSNLRGDDEVEKVHRACWDKTPQEKRMKALYPNFGG